MIFLPRNFVAIIPSRFPNTAYAVYEENSLLITLVKGNRVIRIRL